MIDRMWVVACRGFGDDDEEEEVDVEVEVDEVEACR